MRHILYFCGFFLGILGSDLALAGEPVLPAQVSWHESGWPQAALANAQDQGTRRRRRLAGPMVGAKVLDAAGVQVLDLGVLRAGDAPREAR